MRRWIILLVVAMLVTPAVATAQEATPEPTPLTISPLLSLMLSPSDLGEGWQSFGSFNGVDPDLGAYRTARFYGPNGSRLELTIYDLPNQLSQRADAWNALRGIWQEWADYWHSPNVAPDQRETALPIDESEIPLPKGVNDALRFDGTDPYWGLPVAVGLYALDLGPAVLLIHEGSILTNDDPDALYQVWAIDFVVELLVAKGHS